MEGKPDERSKAELQRLVEQMTNDRDALISEFTEGAEDEEGNNVDSTQAVLKKLNESALEAISTLNYLIQHADSESVKASCAKYVLDWRLGLKVPTATPSDSALEELLRASQERDKE